MSVNEQELSDYLRSDRQWHRPLRISNAEYKFKKARDANNQDRADFWLAVLDALNNDETKR